MRFEGGVTKHAVKSMGNTGGYAIKAHCGLHGVPISPQGPCMTNNALAGPII
jgi:hypothetical protein